MIRLLGDPHLVLLADALMQDPAQRQWLLEYTAQQFGYGPTADIRQKAIIPQFFGSASQPDALDAIRAWTGRLFDDVAITNDVIASGRLASLQFPVDIAFGVNDPYPQHGGQIANTWPGCFRTPKCIRSTPGTGCNGTIPRPWHRYSCEITEISQA